MSYPEEPQLPVEMVLDRSAVLAYVAGSIHVAEPINEVAHDGAAFGVPAVCAAEALAEINDPKSRQKVKELLELDACRVLATDDNWMELAYWRTLTKSIDRACAARAAVQNRAQILTSEYDLYGDVELDINGFDPNEPPIPPAL